ncbi:MAG: glycosyl transferase family 51 [Actinobacteria bacterium HGW-Actinobacteria-4]|nr:MAG: glycosyl transferase family 51 [Actinobacteria bacterium HGW-Actinobacteria-4]
MGLFRSERARRDGRVTVPQLLSSLMMFVAFSIIGGFLIAGLALPAATVATSAAEGTAELFEELPKSLQNANLPQQSNIYARDGETLLATFFYQNRVVVPLEQISPWMQKAVVAVEDKRFWQHNGVDGEGLMRAVYINLTTPDSPGASTLTQQLVKNTLLQNADATGDLDAIADATEVSMARKIREMRLALAYEENVNRQYGKVCTASPEVDCGKEQVLEQYLNIAQFGTRIYGVESAAQFYFKKPAAELTAIEAATIAGITQNPSRWDPVRNPENAETRRNTVLLVMYEQGHINRAEYDEYRLTPIADTLTLNYPRSSCAAATDAPFFCDYITKIIDRDPVFNDPDLPWTGAELLYRGGLNIVTTLDVDKQRIANAELERTLPASDPSGFAMALVALDTTTGQILSMAQNRVFDPSAEAPNSTAINYSVDREYGGSRGFSPGSVFKPVLLAEWLNSGRSLNQVVSGGIRDWEPSSWRASCLGGNPYTGRPWRPGNVGGTSARQQTVLMATANSVNTAYVAMTNQLDLCAVRDMAGTLGFHRSDGLEFEVVPSATLGTQNASPLTMASTYQTFANGGVNCKPIAILSITDANGEEIAVPQEDCRRVITEELSNGVTHALRAVMTVGSGRPQQLAGRVSAGKTGTSQKNAHTWFAGYTPEITSIVWLGHPDRDVPQQSITFNGRRYGFVYGSTLALPTWKRFMDQALAGVPASNMPTASATMLNGALLRVPNVVGMEEKEAQLEINDAGFAYAKDSVLLFSDAYPPGTIVSQRPEADSTLNGGGTVTYVIATNKRPAWWTNWPAGWNPNVAPADWWGSTWPPPEFNTNPPNGWNPNPPDPDPDPDPVPDP